MGSWLHYCFGLSYLDGEEVGDVFSQLVSIMPQHPQLTAFADYVLENYVHEAASFPPSIWAEKSAALWRTTNACESFHSKFNGYFESPHPNIFVFLKTLKRMQTDSYLRMNADSRALVRIDKKTRLKREFIENKIAQLNSGNITHINFVKCVSHKAVCIYAQ